jgi:putative YhdH/YhfP family quinone oxidoreductase
LEKATAMQFPAYVVRKLAGDGGTSAQVEEVSSENLPPGEVLIRVEYSSLNYKDALACHGHPGVVRAFPHVPGIDAAGMVESSESPAFQPGDEVIVTGYELGAGQWGAYARYIRVSGDWVVPRPAGLTLRECMIYGTAGFTAAQAVCAIRDRAIFADHGPIVVTGATGGVGSLAVAILAHLKYDVHAVTGKADAADYLRGIGAREILSREAVWDTSDRPLLSARWKAAVDTVGGNMLATIIRQTDHRGCVTACGLVAGTDLPLTVYPFILRGVTLAGIDSAKCPMPQRRAIWDKLAEDWKVPCLQAIGHEISLRELPESVDAILQGRVRGRMVVRSGR